MAIRYPLFNNSGTPTEMPTTDSLALAGLALDAGATPTAHQLGLQANSLGGISMLAYAADNVSLAFDAYYSSGWKSWDAGSNFAFIKNSDTFNLNYQAGVAVDSAIEWVTALSVDTAGLVNIGALTSASITATGDLIVRESDDGNDAAKLVGDADSGQLELYKAGVLQGYISGDAEYSYFKNSRGIVIGGTTPLANEARYSVVGSKDPTANWQAFSDHESIDSTTAELGTNSFESQKQYSGTQDYDHYAGFQFSPTYNSSGRIKRLTGFQFLPDMAGGNATAVRGVEVRDPVAGSGTIDVLTGVWIQTMTRGTLNYAISIGDSDADQNLIHVKVTGDPVFSWHESNDRFQVDRGFHVARNSLVAANSAANDLVIESTTNAGISILSEVKGNIYFGDAADDNIGYLQYDHSANYFRIAVNTAEVLRIDSAGYVGIGTTTPTEWLTVKPDTDSSVYLCKGKLGYASSGAADYFYIAHTDSFTSTKFGIRFSSAGQTMLNAATGQKIYARINNSASSGFVRDATGFGIGTEAPTHTLDVNSDSIRLRTAKTPASAGATGSTGQIAWDSNYIYICTATNTWKRVAIATW